MGRSLIRFITGSISMMRFLFLHLFARPARFHLAFRECRRESLAIDRDDGAVQCSLRDEQRRSRSTSPGCGEPLRPRCEISAELPRMRMDVSTG